MCCDFLKEDKILNIKKIIFIGLLIFFHWADISAQKTVVFSKDTPSNRHLRTSGLLKKIADSSTLYTRLELLTEQCHAAGYPAFSIDSVSELANHWAVFCYMGPYYGDALIRVPDSARIHIDGNTLNYLKNNAIRLTDYSTFAEKVIMRHENNGHPFCAVSLQDVNLAQDTAGTLCIEPGPVVTYDSVIVRGTAKLKGAFLRPYLSWRRNKKYNERSVSQIPERLSRLPFVSVVREPGVEFVGNRAFLYLFIDRQRVNSFDGYIGLVPVSDATGQVAVNGEVNLNLQNLFTIGERISLQWKAPERYSQFLNVAVEFPYLFGTPFGISGSFILDKKDTTYLNMNYLVALQYSFSGNNDLRTYFQYATSSVLSVNPDYIVALDTLSTDYRKAMYGIQLNINQLDNMMQPWRGVSAQLDLSAGTRTLLPSAKVPLTLLETSELKTANYILKGRIAGYVPIGKRWGWAGGVLGATQFGGPAVYNDLFRIGGTRTLQGFDEQSIYASTYLIATTEFRLRFAKLSYINLFFNAAWYERNVAGAYASDWPFGFGVGATFHTKAGDLYISYALGQQHDSPISFKTGKIHFGMNVRF